MDGHDLIILLCNLMIRLAKPRRWWVAAGVAATLLPAACGGSSTLTHAQLVTRADAACREADHLAARLAAPGASYSALAGYAKELSPIVGRLIDKLAAMNANASDRAPLERYVNALRAGERGLAIDAGASSVAQLAQASSLVNAQSIPAAATTLGAPACGASGPSS